MRRVVPIAALSLVLAAVVGACGSKSKDLLVRPFDGGSDGAVDAAHEAAASTDGGADADPTLGGPCVDDPQCDDKVPCTFDLCDKVALRCRNVPDDTRCDDGIYCNGRERCVAAHGCSAGPVVTCEDGLSCTTDRCLESSKACANAPRDLDGDGDPDDHCVAKHDCDDLDPSVASTHAEVCANHKDDNCDGAVDETPCVSPVGDLCAGALALSPGAILAMSTVGANRDYATSCSVTTPAAARDVVASVTIPPGGNKNLDVWATTPNTEIALAIQGTCGQATSELACGGGSGGSSVRARAYDLAPGTYYVLVTTQSETTLELRAVLSDSVPRPANETCATAIPIAPGVVTPVSIVDPAKDLASACAAYTGELTYALTLAAPQDVKIFATTTLGSGAPVVGLRAPPCASAADELRCNVGSELPLFARNLAAGTYVVTVAGTSSIDASVLVKTSPPTVAPPDQTCAAPPLAQKNATMDVDLTDHEAAIQDGCRAGGPTAALDLPLANASDVMLIGRFPLNEAGSVSFDAPACKPADRFACGNGPSPVRITKRGVPAGDYRVVMSDALGSRTTLTTLVRDAVPPTIVVGMADDCASAVDIPPTGGFFTGDTSLAKPDFDNGCDTSSSSPLGARDQVLRLTLTESKRVVLNMDGSTYTTILDVRRGPTCPGQPVDGACYVGFAPSRSFLDLQLPPGVYFILIDGYNGEKGPWNLDVRVL